MKIIFEVMDLFFNPQQADLSSLSQIASESKSILDDYRQTKTDFAFPIVEEQPETLDSEPLIFVFIFLAIALMAMFVTIFIVKIRTRLD